ncbi:SGNH/GDSL hydrolase family protein, partial [Streptomyces sparsus]
SEAVQRSYASADGAGDRTGQPGGAGFRPELRGWPFLTGVDVRGGPGSVVALGDSITDGVASTPGTNRRWPDVLARRLQRAGRQGVPRYGVLNHGISANRVVSDRYDGDGVSGDTGGVSAEHRLDRDVLGQTGVRTVVLFEGINDVRWGYPAQNVIDGLRSLAERSRQRGLRVVAATVAPCGGWPDCSPEVERRRQAVNAFVRDHGGTFDAVLDFDAALRDPAAPQRLLPHYDSGDHLHPGDAGLRAVADSVDLSALVARTPSRR